MIFRSLRDALILTVVFVGGCQTYAAREPAPIASTPMDGTWASGDGVFVASFERGQFVSQFTKTNEMLARGSYTVSGNAVTMNWISVATKQQRSAACTFRSADVVSCDQQGGGRFELHRGANMPMAAAAGAPSAPPPQ